MIQDLRELWSMDSDMYEKRFLEPGEVELSPAALLTVENLNERDFFKWMLSAKFDNGIKKLEDVIGHDTWKNGMSTESCIPVEDMYTPLIELNTVPPTAVADLSNAAPSGEVSEATYSQWLEDPH